MIGLCKGPIVPPHQYDLFSAVFELCHFSTFSHQIDDLVCEINMILHVQQEQNCNRTARADRVHKNSDHS